LEADNFFLVGLNLHTTRCFSNVLASFPIFRTKSSLEKKLAQTTGKYEEEKASMKKHHSTIAKVWISN